MAAALAVLKPLSMTFLSVCGSASMAPAATSSATSARIMRPLYGARYGSSERRGFSEVPLGRSRSFGALTETEPARIQFPPHAEVARETVERITKRGRLVALETEVPDPRKGVS